MKQMHLEDISTRGLPIFASGVEDAESLSKLAENHTLTAKEKELLYTAGSTVYRKKSPVEFPSFTLYDTSVFDQGKLKLVDQQTLGSVLVLNSPFYFYPSKDEKIAERYSIYELKHILTHTDRRGGTLIYITPSQIEKIADAIHLYERQVLDLAEEHREVTPDFFTIDLEERKIAVKDYQSELIEQLCAIEDSLVWGKLSSYQKQTLYRAVASRRKNRVLENLLRILANYMTLEQICKEEKREQGIQKLCKKEN